MTNGADRADASSCTDPTEASGDGHKTDEDVCVRGAERVETGTSASQPA